MKIIHTSDWHLGRSFGPISLQSDQEAFVDWFVDLVIDEQPDLVVIAGDLYDRAIAPREAIALFRDAVGRLLATGTVVAAITGNHDAADRVAPYAGLLDLSCFYLRGGYDRVGTVITHEFDDGPVDLVLLPYLDPRAAPDDFGAGPPGEDPPPSGDSTAAVRSAEPDAGPGDVGGQGDIEQLLDARRFRTHHSVLADAIHLARPHLRTGRRIAVAHAFVTGGSTSDSERQLVVGGTGSVDASLFDTFDYVALGHLHRPQPAGLDTIRYSGTPLAYSFSEDHPKSVTIVDLPPTGAPTVRTEPIPVGRPVRTLQGDIDDLLRSDAHPEAHDAFVRAVLTDRTTVLDARSRLMERYPHLVEVQLLPAGVEPTAPTLVEGIAELEPIDAVRGFWRAVEDEPPDDHTDRLLRQATTRAMEAMNT